MLVINKKKKKKVKLSRTYPHNNNNTQKMSYIGDLHRIFKNSTRFFLQSIFVAVSFIDPGNFSSNTTSGATYQYKLLFIIFISNVFAILLQCLCIKLGSVTGLDLAENCRKHLPRNVNLALYVFSELAIIATDLAEVVGTAVALEILFNIPLNYGVLLTVFDVIAILFFYNADSSISRIRLFEFMVSILVGLTILCFIMELFKVDISSKRELFEGFLPSRELLQDKAVYLGCAIVGATVMPHSLFLGSSLVQPRLKEYDHHHGLLGSKDNVESEARSNENQLLLHSGSNHHSTPPRLSPSYSDDGAAVLNNFGIRSNNSDLDKKYQPSAESINHSLPYSYGELIISLFFVATFVNSAILIVAGSALYGTPDAEDADLVSIYRLLTQYVSQSAGLVFALAMLFSGQASGLVVTLAGQVVSEGFIHWTFKPWVRRLLTRLIAIIPCLLVTYTMGNKGINDILNGSQVVLSFILPFCSAPLVYFTCSKKIMRVRLSNRKNKNFLAGSSTTTEEHSDHDNGADDINYGSVDNLNVNGSAELHNDSSIGELSIFEEDGVKYVDYSNSTTLATVSILAWATIAVLNGMNIVFMVQGLV